MPGTSAEIVPSGTAISAPINVAISATCSDSSSREAISSRTGRPVHSDVPRSSFSKPGRPVRELRRQRIGEAEARALLFDRLLRHGRAVTPHLDLDDVARQHAQDQEDHDGGGRERRDEQRETGGDEAQHRQTRMQAT